MRAAEAKRCTSCRRFDVHLDDCCAQPSIVVSLARALWLQNNFLQPAPPMLPFAGLAGERRRTSVSPEQQG